MFRQTTRVGASSWRAMAFIAVAAVPIFTLTSPERAGAPAAHAQAPAVPAVPAAQAPAPVPPPREGEAQPVVDPGDPYESLADGPYLTRAPDGSAWIARRTSGAGEIVEVTEQQLPMLKSATALRMSELKVCPPICGGSRGSAVRADVVDARHADAEDAPSVQIAAVGRVPPFTVRLRAPDPVADHDVPLPPDAPLFVVADTHGQFEILVQLLQKHGVLDRDLKWSYGRGRLALLGDVFDRGPNHTEIMWLIYKLEAEAARAGGGVHFVLGNHEALVMLGDQDDQHPRYQRITRALKAPSHAALWGKDTLLGAWLRTHASVLKIGDSLCLHGGISRAAIDRKLTVAKMNQAVRDALNYTTPQPGPLVPLSTIEGVLLNEAPHATDAERELTRFVMGRGGPLWYRGYFPEEPGFAPATDEDLARICDYYGVRRLLVGHTARETITPLYNGKAIAVQVAMTRDAAGTPRAEGLVIKGGTLWRASIDGTMEPLSGHEK